MSFPLNRYLQARLSPCLFSAAFTTGSAQTMMTQVIATYQASLYSHDDAANWDEFLQQCPMGTFLHSRRFLGYHGDRFIDRSLVLRDEKGIIVGLFPAAQSPANPKQISSHPGITYGALLHNGSLMNGANLEALKVIRSFYADMGYESLLYKAIPYIYHQEPSNDDLYSLFQLGAERIRCDLCATIDLKNPGDMNRRRKRTLQKSVAAGIDILEGHEYAAQIWPILEARLVEKHGAKPVHSLEEIELLGRLFPEEIRFVIAKQGDTVLAGGVYFVMPTNVHMQYSASNPAGYEMGAIDALFQYCMSRGRDLNVRYFDFGNSNEEGGWVLNNGLYHFKSEFGASGTVQEFYQLSLK